MWFHVIAYEFICLWVHTKGCHLFNIVLLRMVQKTKDQHWIQNWSWSKVKSSFDSNKLWLLSKSKLAFAWQFAWPFECDSIHWQTLNALSFKKLHVNVEHLSAPDCTEWTFYIRFQKMISHASQIQWACTIWGNISLHSAVAALSRCQPQVTKAHAASAESLFHWVLASQGFKEPKQLRLESARIKKILLNLNDSVLDIIRRWEENIILHEFHHISSFIVLSVFISCEIQQNRRMSDGFSLRRFLRSQPCYEMQQKIKMVYAVPTRPDESWKLQLKQLKAELKRFLFSWKIESWKKLRSFARTSLPTRLEAVLLHWHLTPGLWA